MKYKTRYHLRSLRNDKYIPKRTKIIDGVCRFCIKDGIRVNLALHTSELGPDIKWCPRCGACHDWWLQTDYYLKKIVEFHYNNQEMKSKTKIR